MYACKHLFIDSRKPHKEAEDEQEGVVHKPGDKELPLVVEGPQHQANVD